MVARLERLDHDKVCSITFITSKLVDPMMTRTLFALLFACSIGFVAGCNSSTEPTVIEDAPQMTEQEEVDYDAEMDADESDDG